MMSVTVIIEFDNGTQAAFIGPMTNELKEQLDRETTEVKAVGFSEPTEFPDCKLSDIEQMVYKAGTQH